MPLKLFELAGANPQVRFSPQCWKTRMALAHKGLAAETVGLRFGDKERIAFSGQPLVPVLMDGKQVINDSWQIALHLESSWPANPTLFGAANAIPLAALINAWTDTTLLPAMARIILMDVFNQIDPSDRDYFRASREVRYGTTLEDFVANGTQHRLELHQLLAPLRKTLGQQAFIAGDAPAYADYCAFGIFMWARCTSAQVVLEEDDAVYAWHERLLDAFGGLARSAPRAYD